MFIKDMSCITAQATFPNQLFETGLTDYDTNLMLAQEPSYKDIIPFSQLRRMGKLVRMSVAAALPMIEKHQSIDSIIFGSTNGSLGSSVRFLNQIVDYSEGRLTPTDFVQSTPNCVAGVLALMGKIRGYNTTHVNQGLTFESVLLDALMLFEEKKSKRIILGSGGEELSNFNIQIQRGQYKTQVASSLNVLNDKSNGTIAGEGVAVFVMDKERDQDSLAELVDVDMISHANHAEVLEKMNQFLERNNLSLDQIDALLLGRNGDIRTDGFYDVIQKELTDQQHQLAYKHIFGEYYSVSALATWLAAHLLKGNQLPDPCFLHQTDRAINRVLIYNHFEGVQHGFILMNKVN